VVRTELAQKINRPAAHSLDHGRALEAFKRKDVDFCGSFSSSYDLDGVRRKVYSFIDCSITDAADIIAGIL
jgi:hypothetical protein